MTLRRFFADASLEKPGQFDNLGVALVCTLLGLIFLWLEGFVSLILLFAALCLIGANLLQARQFNKRGWWEYIGSQAFVADIKHERLGERLHINSERIFYQLSGRPPTEWTLPLDKVRHIEIGSEGRFLRLLTDTEKRELPWHILDKSTRTGLLSWLRRRCPQAELCPLALKISQGYFPRARN